MAELGNRAAHSHVEADPQICAREEARPAPEPGAPGAFQSESALPEAELDVPATPAWYHTHVAQPVMAAVWMASDEPVGGESPIEATSGPESSPAVPIDLPPETVAGVQPAEISISTEAERSEPADAPAIETDEDFVADQTEFAAEIESTAGQVAVLDAQPSDETLEELVDPTRQPESARDWLLARMEQAEAAHFGRPPPMVPVPEPAHMVAAEVQVPEPEPVLLPEPALLPERAAADVVETHVAAIDNPSPPPRPVIAPASVEISAPPPDALDVRAFDDVPAETHEPAQTPELSPEIEVLPPHVIRRPKVRGFIHRVAHAAAYVSVCYFTLVMALILVYRVVNPPASTLMLYEGLFGAGARQTWVPLEQISPHLVRAVIVAEDGRFCEHHGVDFVAIGEAIENTDDGIPRGASTISMQVTKNLFLWQPKSYRIIEVPLNLIRKILELPLTLIVEIVWPKSRVLEVYLNIAEWGPGVFGAEAAAQHHFNRSAASLSEREAAQLAAALPNPIRRDAGDPGPRLQRKANVIQNRARSSGDVDFCVKRSRPAARSAAVRGTGAAP